MRVVGLLLLLAGCSSVRVEVDYNPAFDFASARTYGWTQGIAAPNPLTQETIESGIDRALQERGFVRSDAADPQLWVSTIVGGHSELQALGDGDQLAHSGRVSRERFGVTTEQPPRLQEVTIGTLMIEILDHESGGVVWRARAEETVSGSPEEMTRKVDEAIATAFRDFPPDPD